MSRRTAGAHGRHAAEQPLDAQPAETSASAGRARRVRALLVGGLVLGVGASITLAAWNDAEFGSGSFEASVFNTESNSGSGWASNVTAPGATLAFSASDDLSPGDSDYAYLDIRTTSATTVDGVVELDSSAKSGDLADSLEYRAVLTTTATTCTADAFTGTPTWVAGGASSYIAAGAMPSTPPSTSIDAAATETHRYCFEVRVEADAPSSAQGTTATLTWGFAATSTG